MLIVKYLNIKHFQISLKIERLRLTWFQPLSFKLNGGLKHELCGAPGGSLLRLNLFYLFVCDSEA